jgi:hypothetical protein
MDYSHRINDSDDEQEQGCTIGDCSDCQVYAWCKSNAPIEVHADASGELEDW